MNNRFKILIIISFILSSCGFFLDKHKLAEDLSGLEIPTTETIIDFRNQFDDYELLPPKNNLVTFIPEINKSLGNQGIYQLKQDLVDPGEFTLVILDKVEQKLLIYHSMG